EHLARHGVVDAVHTRDPVANRDDAANLGDIDIDGVAADLLADDLGDFFGFDVHCLLRGPVPPGARRVSYPCCSSRWRIFSSCRVMLASYPVVPTRATSPPIIVGSPLVFKETFRPVALARRCAIASA